MPYSKITSLGPLACCRVPNKIAKGSIDDN
jgi:hypothetical protein